MSLLFFTGDASLKIGKLKRWDPHVSVVTGEFVVWTCKEIDLELSEGRRHLPCRWNKLRRNTSGVRIDKQEEDKETKWNKNHSISSYKLGIWNEQCKWRCRKLEVRREPVKEKAEWKTHSLRLWRPWLLSSRSFTR